MKLLKKIAKLIQFFFKYIQKIRAKKGEGFLEDEIFFKEFVLNEDFFSFVDKKELCKENRQLEIIDFDEHLENLNLNWRNIFLE